MTDDNEGPSVREVARQRLEQARAARAWARANPRIVRAVAVAMAIWSCAQLAHHKSPVAVALAGIAVGGVVARIALKRCPRPQALRVIGVAYAAAAWCTADVALPNRDALLTVVLAAATWGYVIVNKKSFADTGSDSDGGDFGPPSKWAARWDEHADGDLEMKGSHATGEKPDQYGVDLRIRQKAGQDGEALTYEKTLRRVESVFGLGRATVSGKIVQTDTRSAVLRIITKDPHTKPLSWPGESMHSIYQPINIGTYANGKPTQLRLFTEQGAQHMIICGATGSGKSSLINLMLTELTACPDVAVIGIDLKGGQELGPWRDALPLVVDNAEDALAVMQALSQVLEDRAKTAGKRTLKPSPSMPSLVVIVDECAEFWAMTGAITATESVIRRARSLGVHLILATQNPLIDAFGSRTIRGQGNVRVVFRMQERGQSGNVLQALKDSVDASNLPPSGGYFYIESSNEAEPDRARTFYIPEDQLDALIASRPHRELPADVAQFMPRRTPQQNLPAVDGEQFSPENGDLQPTTVLVDVAGDVAAHKAKLMQMLTARGSEGVQLMQMKRAVQRPNSTLYDWLDDWQRQGLVERIDRGLYALVAT